MEINLPGKVRVEEEVSLNMETSLIEKVRAEEEASPNLGQALS
jgi:hypothetical protein